MKLWHLLFLLQSSFILITLTVRVQDQFTFQMLQDSIPDPSSDTSSSQSQTENHILTNTDICNNLLEYLLVFGETATSKYKTCPEKYSLLGNSNSLVQKDQPQCLISLSQIFCTYEIVTDSVRPHPDDLRYFITQTISRCIRVIIFFGKMTNLFLIESRMAKWYFYIYLSFTGLWHQDRQEQRRVLRKSSSYASIWLYNVTTRPRYLQFLL